MTRIDPRSADAAWARRLVVAAQYRLGRELERVSAAHGHPLELTTIEWLRDGGRHGGGARMMCADTPVFNRATINVSSVHYDDDPTRRLGSATALSTIIHPAAPRAPSMHMHVSWTELRDGTGYWRVMADLNPAIEDTAATARFRDAMRAAAPDVYDDAAAQGDRYFWIPALGRHRGVTHFYLESYASGDGDADRALAERFSRAVIDAYVAELDGALAAAGEPTSDERRRQLEYHTLYAFQVLTLDRGTTSGLLVHGDNDAGILGSLPARLDRELLSTWAGACEPPQDELVRALVAALPAGAPCELTDADRVALAGVVRAHYRAHPEALALQARGDVIPPTVANHTP